MKKTIKNYCFNATQAKLDELCKIGQKYSSVKNEIFSKYGSISGFSYLSYPRKIRDEWIKTGYANKFGLQARYWKMAFDEAFANIKLNLSNAIGKVKINLFQNKGFTEEEKHYAFYLLKATDLLYKAILLRDFNIPDKFQDKPIRRDKVHKYLKSRLRKYIGKRSYQYKHNSFQIDKSMYDVYIDEKGRLWIGIMGLVPRKRIRLQMTSSIKPESNLRVVLKDKKIEIHSAVDIDVKEITIGKNVVAIDKGFTEVITSSSGKRYGKGFDEILKVESDRLLERNKNRNKLRALSKKYEEKGNIIKAELIKKNNLGKKKYLKQKEIELNKIKGFINKSLNEFIAEEQPTILCTESLTFTNWNKKLPKNIRRYFSS